MDTVLMISSWDCDQFSIFNLLCREITLSTVITLIMEDRKEFLSYLISTDTCFGWPFINSLCGSEWLYPRRLVSLLQSHCCFINLKWDLYVQWDLELQPVRNEMFPLILPQGELVGNLSLTSDSYSLCGDAGSFLGEVRCYLCRSRDCSCEPVSPLSAVRESCFLHVTQERIYIANCKYG